jgi:hypothetical protein
MVKNEIEFDLPEMEQNDKIKQKIQLRIPSIV